VVFARSSLSAVANFSRRTPCSEANRLLTCAAPGRNTTRPKWKPATTRRRISHPQVSHRPMVRWSGQTCSTTASIHRFSPTPQHRPPDLSTPHPHVHQQGRLDSLSATS